MLAVSGFDPAQVGAMQPVQRFDAVAVALMPAQQGVAVVALIHQHHAFIGLEMLLLRVNDSLQRQLLLVVQGSDRLRIGAEFTEPCVEIIDRDVVVDVVLGLQAHRISLDSQVDVFADQHHLRWLRQPAASHLLEGHRKDVVVAASPLQFCR